MVVCPYFMFISELRVEQFAFGVLGLWHLGITVWVSLLIFENLIRMMMMITKMKRNYICQVEIVLLFIYGIRVTFFCVSGCGVEAFGY